ncbi:MAG: M56 family metallopeptidase [bacterium]
MTTEIFTEKIVFSLGWTFINSLWQGGFICIINWIVLMMLSKQNARLRYIVSSISLFTILLFAVISFFILGNYYDLYLSDPGISIQNGVTESVQNGIYSLFFLEFIPVNSSAYLDYFNSNLPLIISIWFWSVLFLSLKQMGGFALTQRLVHYKTTIPSSGWQQRVNQLAQFLGIKKSVRLLESAIVKIPTVVGYFKPVILIPLGLLLAIPENQLEAIILHELAHIKRRDFLVNILQNILEVIFFFNPFVWLISSNIRSEREHCCDDMVVKFSGDTISYIKALANISAIDPDKSGYAMALSLNQNHLFKRIDRIIKMKNYKSNFNRVIISALVLAIGIAFLSISAVNGYASPQSVNQQEEKKTQSSTVKQTGKTVDKNEIIKELEKKYNATNNPEEKKKIEQLITEIKSDKIAFAQVPDELKKKEQEQMMQELKKKYKEATDEETKKKIEAKMKAIQKGSADAGTDKDSDLKKKQAISELKKKQEAATDEETKKKIEKKIQSIKEENGLSATDKELAAKEKADLEKKELTLKKEQQAAGKDIELSKKEKDNMLQELKKKYEATTNEETKTELLKKIKELEEK